MRLGYVVVLKCLKASCINDLEELNVDFFKLATLPHFNRLPIHHPMNIRFSHETVHISMLLQNKRDCSTEKYTSEDIFAGNCYRTEAKVTCSSSEDSTPLASLHCIPATMVRLRASKESSYRE